MAATELIKAKKFAPGTGLVRIINVPNVASLATPTRPEIDAGDDMSENVQAVAGFDTSATFSDEKGMTPRADKVFQGDNYNDSSLTFFSDRSGENNPVDQLGWQRGDIVFIAFLDHGDVTGAPFDIYECEVGSISKTRSGTAHVVTVSFGIQDVAENVSVPAA